MNTSIVFPRFSRYFCGKRFLSAVHSKAVPLTYTSYGNNSDKSPVLILHGLLGSKNNWHTLSKYINERTQLQIYALDIRNHGESPHTDEMDFDVLADDIQLFMEKHAFDRVKLIGHSFGGRISIHFALKHPEKVDGMVSVDVSHIKKDVSGAEIPNILNVLENLDLSPAKSLPDARRLAEKALQPVCESKPVRLFLCTNINRGINQKFYWKFNIDTINRLFKQSIQHHPQPVIGSYSGPSLFIAGADSNYIEPKDHNKILENFPNAKIQYIKDAGHDVHSEKPFEFLDLVVPFLNSL